MIKEKPNIRKSNMCFLFCIIFQVVGIMTVPFFGVLGGQMAIYFLTFLFGLFLSLKNKSELSVPLKVPKPKLTFLVSLITICGIPIAMLLNALAGILTTAGADDASDVNKYSLWVAVICFAVVPAIVEEFIFRGIILEEYLKIGTRAAVLISSIYFALLHFSLGSVLYGFFFGIIFALVRIETGNLSYTIIMHCLFNLINVLLSYIPLNKITNLMLVLFMGVGIIAFVITMRMFVKKYPVALTKSNHKWYRLITKEGYITMAVCVLIMGMLLSM